MVLRVCTLLDAFRTSVHSRLVCFWLTKSKDLVKIREMILVVDTLCSRQQVL